MRFKKKALSEVCRFIDYRGKTPTKTSFGIPLVTAKIVKNGIIGKPSEFISPDSYDAWMRRGIPKKGDVLITTEAPLGEVAQINTDDKVAFAQRVIVLCPKREELLPDYLLYTLQSTEVQQRIRARETGTTVTGIKSAELKKVEIDIPSIQEQAKIAEILKHIDAKRVLNAKLNDYLLELATALFESALQTEHREVKFGDIVELEDSKRIPLNSRDREQRNGPYPYYGATSVMDYVDDYLFDGIRILLGEDGSVITDDGYPVLQYVWGKYWVNNHAHILKPCAEYSMEMLYVALSRTAIPHIVTGAVQKKISQKNLNSLILEMPNPEDVKGLEDMFSLYRNNVDESRKLEHLRDTLLPKLMSGELDVSAIVVSNNE